MKRLSVFGPLVAATVFAAILIVGAPTRAFPAALVLGSADQTLSGLLQSNGYLAANIVGGLLVLLVLWHRGFFRARTLCEPRRDAAAHHPIIWFVSALIVWLSAAAAMGLAAGLLSSGADVSKLAAREKTLLLGFGYGASLCVGAVLVYLLKASAPGSGLAVSAGSFVKGAGLMVVAWPLVACAGAAAVGLHLLAGGAPPEPLAHATLQAMVDHPNDPWIWGQVALAVIAAPIQEEIVYRAMLQSALLAATRKVWVSVVITAAIFAAAHISPGSGVPWYAAVGLFALALAIGMAYERSGKLTTAIGMHVAFNVANVVMAIATTRN